MVKKKCLITIFISIGFLLLSLIGIAIHVQTGVFIHENTRFWDTPDEIKSISSARRGYESAAEMKIE
jgi:hypothetical protein